ncbi:hypothetical protein Bbelb_222600, partial [Branchiostoma belcheri]
MTSWHQDGGGLKAEEVARSLAERNCYREKRGELSGDFWRNSAGRPASSSSGRVDTVAIGGMAAAVVPSVAAAVGSSRTQPEVLLSGAALGGRFHRLFASPAGLHDSVPARSENHLPCKPFRLPSTFTQHNP